jgi:hypothetical protein
MKARPRAREMTKLPGRRLTTTSAQPVTRRSAVFRASRIGAMTERMRATWGPIRVKDLRPAVSGCSQGLPRAGTHSANPAGDGRDGGRCESAGLARPDEGLRHAPHLSLPQHANETLAMSNSRACLRVRENGIGNLEMLVSLASSHFQHVGWK